MIKSGDGAVGERESGCNELCESHSLKNRGSAFYRLPARLITVYVAAILAAPFNVAHQKRCPSVHF